VRPRVGHIPASQGDTGHANCCPAAEEGAEAERGPAYRFQGEAGPFERKIYLYVYVLAGMIYPVYEEEAVVALRGRAVDCTCPKWLNSKGSKVALWGSQYLRLGAQVYIVENPVDAMLLMQEWPTKVAVAGTGGAGTWRDEWTKRILTSRPSQIWIVYDNDVAGKNGSAKVAQSFGGMGKGLGFSLFNYIWPGFSKEGADVGDMMIVQQREGGVTA